LLSRTYAPFVSVSNCGGVFGAVDFVVQSCVGPGMEFVYHVAQSAEGAAMTGTELDTPTAQFGGFIFE